MPRYFFDIHDHTVFRDEEGIDLPGPEEAGQRAKKLLPEIAAHELPAHGSERQAITVLVTDDQGHPIYSAALSYVGTWLRR